MLRAEAVKLRRRAPPVVVISLEKDLPARDRGDEGKILDRAVQLQRPAEVTQQDGRILRPDHGKARAELVHIALPPAAEYVHRLVRLQRQVQVSDRIQCHYRSSMTASAISVF